MCFCPHGDTQARGQPFCEKPDNGKAATYSHPNETEPELAYNHGLMKSEKII
jgi:hypothetical protein